MSATKKTKGIDDMTAATKKVLTTGKKGRPKKVEKADPRQLDLDFEGMMTALEKSEDAKGMILAMLASRAQDFQGWRGQDAVPPGSLADKIVREFRLKTNIPLEIPFFTFLSVISGYLLNRGVYVQSDMGEVQPDLWTVVLASSGAGKTFTKSKISNGLSASVGDIEFGGTGIVSAAAFAQALSEKPRGLWVRDEFARLLKNIDDETGPMAEMKDYLLRLYDNGTIERRTKKDTVTAENPALTILGMTVLETFKDFVSAESMLDGFAQRFAYVVAKADPTRPWRDYPLWSVDNQTWGEDWAKIEAAVQPVYTVDRETMQAAFGAAFQSCYNQQIPESFFRRLIWRATKYAVVYHVIRGDAGAELTAEDFGWAARAIQHHVNDMAWLIGDHNLSSLERVIQAAERLDRHYLDTKGRHVTARELVAGVRAISSAGMARQILDMIVHS